MEGVRDGKRWKERNNKRKLELKGGKERAIRSAHRRRRFRTD